MEVTGVTAIGPKYDVFGLGVTRTTVAETLERIGSVLHSNLLRVVFANVHTTMSCRHDATLRESVNSAELVVPDGVPLVWAMDILHGIEVERMRGPTFMRVALRSGVDRGWRHFFYGSDQATLDDLVANAESFAPGVQIVGALSPPFGDFTDDRVAEDLRQIRETNPDVVWVGLGMPKQELWMAAAARSGLGTGFAILGVGAAFDLLAGRLPEAPQWMQKVGLEWLFRLRLEPRRLWRRYIVNNPLFLAHLICAYGKKKLRLLVTRRPEQRPRGENQDS